MSEPTKVEIKRLFAAQREFFSSGSTRSRKFRAEALADLEKLLVENSEPICEALHKDLRKPRHESLIAELAMTLEEVRIAKKNLARWMRPQRSRTPWVFLPARSQVYFEPLGVGLIVGPWNYPFQLLMAPLVGALAAGCCAILKPSELTTHTSKLVEDLVRRYFSPEHVAVVEGGVAETTALLELKFDHIFFTGSTLVGKVVMEAAAKNLVPVTLELGGKSPTIVCDDADLDLAARRIVWGKCYNAGQTCVAPDYVYVHRSIAGLFAAKLKAEIVKQFGNDPQKSASFSRVVNGRHFQRLRTLIQPEKVYHGGRSDENDLYIEPTILDGVSWQDKVMCEEIFGPILPLLIFDELSEVYAKVNSQPKPLSAYFFSRSTAKQNQFVEDLAFGGGCINDVMVHLSNPDVPFGGVGDSGIGRYHGHHSFLAFSHEKTVMRRGGLFDFSARYAPYDERKTGFMRRVFRI